MTTLDFTANENIHISFFIDITNSNFENTLPTT